MRCPKCSFISFDDLATCAKCSNDLAALSEELQGSCTEVRSPFFLSAVVQAPELDESFADEQPVIDDTDVSFDDSGESATDDISLELGDIMPVDMDQLDEPLALADDAGDETGELSLDDLGDGLEDDDIDLDLSGDFESPDFNTTEAIDLDSSGQDELDISLDADALGDVDFDETSLVLEPLGTDATLPDGDSLDLDDEPSDAEATGDSFGLDDDLMAELQAESAEDLTDGESLPDLGDDLADFAFDDTGAGLKPVSAGDSVNADDTFAGGESLDLDADLLAELQAGSVADTTEGESFADIGDDFTLNETSIDLESGSDGESFDADDTFAGGESLGLDADLLAELRADADENLTDNDLAAFTFEDTGADLKAISGGGRIDADSTLSGHESFDLGEELRETMTGEFPTLDPDATTAIELDDELASFGLDSTITEPEPAADSENADDTLVFDDSPLEDLSFDVEDEVLLDEELPATPDDEPELDLAGLKADSQDDELALDDVPLEDFSLDTEDEEQLGDELLATMDDELDLDLAELDPDSKDEELTLDDTLGENLDDDTEEELLGDTFSLDADDELEPEEVNAAPAHSSSAVLEQIEVSDLISSAEDESLSALDDEEIDLSSLMGEDEESDASAIDMLDDDIPEMELLDDDGDDTEGPPDLP